MQKTRFLRKKRSALVKLSSIGIVFLSLFVLCFALLCPLTSYASLSDIPLEWRPTDPIGSYDPIDLAAYRHAAFVIKPFRDMRKNTAEIGANVEAQSSNRDLRVTTKDNVAVWLTDQFGSILKEFRITVVKSQGTLTLEADVTTFFVTEKSMYQAEVALKVRLKAKNNTVVWSGTTSGSASRFGHSYKAENYYEALSNATVSAVHGLLKNESFVQAVRKNK